MPPKEGNKIIEESCVIENACLLLVKHQNYWASISNKQQCDFDFLQISLSNNPLYDQVKITLERTQVISQEPGLSHNIF